MQTLFTQLGELLKAIADISLSLIQQTIVGIFKLPAWLWQMIAYLSAAITTVLSITVSVFGIVAAAVKEIIQKINGMQDGGTLSMPSTNSDFLAGINTFIPLDEAFNFMTVLMALIVTCFIIRTIKAWLPQIHGWGFH